MTSGPATQRDVAWLAGVSPVTVSRTLAGGRYVRPDVQEKVRAAARQLDYLPNENGRSLRPGQASGLIGVVITSLSNRTTVSSRSGSKMRRRPATGSS